MAMSPFNATAISLRPWRMTDGELLSALNTPVMTAHTGGPESAQKLSQRLQRYAEPYGDGEMFVIEDPSGQPLGSIGYWRREWQGEQVYETGWAVLPEFQGGGIASEAARLVIQRAAAAGGASALHAYPRIDHPASNATCRKAGFRLVGVVDFEYPPGNPIRSNDWVADLTVPG
jgi:RimJ/RimL family protein N-acetyltransferase